MADKSFYRDKLYDSIKNITSTYSGQGYDIFITVDDFNFDLPVKLRRGKWIIEIINLNLMVPKEVSNPDSNVIIRIYANCVDGSSGYIEKQDMLVDLDKKLFCTIHGSYLPVKNANEVCEKLKERVAKALENCDEKIHP